MSEKLEDIKTLEDFNGWDSDAPDIDFFSGDEDDKTEKATKLDSEQDEEDLDDDITDLDDDDKDASGKETEEDDEVDLFSLDIGDDESEASDDEEDKDLSTNNSALATLNFLKEKGLANYELEEGQELDEDSALQLLEDSYEESLDKRMEELFEDMPPVVKQMVKFAANGGDVNTLISSFKVQAESELNVDMDMSEVANQKLVARTMLEKEGFEKDVIDIQIESLADSGKLEKFAKARHDKWKQETENEREELATRQREAKLAEKQRHRDYKNSVTKLVKETEVLRGLVLSKEDKKELPDYVAEKNIRLQNGQSISRMQKDLYDALQDSEKALVLAKILKSDFDMSDFKRAAQTEVSKKQRDSIRRNTNSNPKKSGGTNSKTRKALADFF